MASILASLDADGDGDIDSSEWAAGYAQLGKSAPGVPNPAVWYGTLPDGPAFKIEQVSMQKMYHATSQLVEKSDDRDETGKGVMVGYAGHVPGHDLGAFGTSHWNRDDWKVSPTPHGWRGAPSPPTSHRPLTGQQTGPGSRQRVPAGFRSPPPRMANLDLYA